MPQLGSNIYKNLKFLNKISQRRSNQFIRKLIGVSTAPQLIVLIEIAANIRKGNFHYTTLQKRALIRHDKPIRGLAKAKSFDSILHILNTYPTLLRPLIFPIVHRVNTHKLGSHKFNSR